MRFLARSAWSDSSTRKLSAESEFDIFKLTVLESRCLQISYEVFQARTLKLAGKLGLSLDFRNYLDGFEAIASDGTIITGNLKSHAVRVLLPNGGFFDVML